jgi:hypothetical protein
MLFNTVARLCGQRADWRFVLAHAPRSFHCASGAFSLKPGHSQPWAVCSCGNG